MTLFILALVLTSIFIYLYYKNRKPRYLVFSSVGDRNNVKSWISNPGKKNFDLVIYYFGEKESPVFNADLLVTRKGLKFENFYHFLTHNDLIVHNILSHKISKVHAYVLQINSHIKLSLYPKYSKSILYLLNTFSCKSSL